MFIAKYYSRDSGCRKERGNGIRALRIAAHSQFCIYKAMAVKNASGM